MSDNLNKIERTVYQTQGTVEIFELIDDRDDREKVAAHIDSSLKHILKLVEYHRNELEQNKEEEPQA
ncbi:MAG: hypothetical protein DRJ03_27365 [Chloroflexi bacterium]|nr:MAG: hypothetical protein DRJ03_27365 [Chloroflexota bacterium]